MPNLLIEMELTYCHSLHAKARRAPGEASQESRASVAAQECKEGWHWRRLPARRKEDQKRDHSKLRIDFRTGFLLISSVCNSENAATVARLVT